MYIHWHLTLFALVMTIWASLVAQLQCGRSGFHPWVGKISWRRERLPTPVFWPGEFHGLYSQSIGSQTVGHDWVTHTFTFLLFSWLKISVNHSVVPNSLWPFGLYPARHLCPWDSPGKNTGVGCHFLLQGIFVTQGSNSHLLPCGWFLCHWATREAPKN